MDDPVRDSEIESITVGVVVFVVVVTAMVCLMALVQWLFEG